jgi:hypothetical protein
MGIMDLPNDGIIRITDKTPDADALAALLGAFFAYKFQRKADEFTEVVFRNRNVQPIADTVVIVTHRTPGPMVKVQMAFRAAWAMLSANKKLTVRFEIDEIWESE